ncbi:hypothetical protein OPQ81_011264 [Rhizoctonia solani]|nr:hypothetical protein OPQ81_011264 [Rhizoctonia solani]
MLDSAHRPSHNFHYFTRRWTDVNYDPSYVNIRTGDLRSSNWERMPFCSVNAPRLADHVGQATCFQTAVKVDANTRGATPISITTGGKCWLAIVSELDFPNLASNSWMKL